MNHLFHGLWLSILAACASPGSVGMLPSTVSSSPPELRAVIDMEQLRNTYDTLIPVLGGLFITRQQVDTAAFRVWSGIGVLSKDLEEYPFRVIGHVPADAVKWGVIDSTGKVIVPFICDGICGISDEEGIVSVYSGSYPLNTGVPRYKYQGWYYYFDRTGLYSEDRGFFEMTVVFIADFHQHDFVSHYGPFYYLPPPCQGEGTQSPGSPERGRQRAQPGDKGRKR